MLTPLKLPAILICFLSFSSFDILRAQNQTYYVSTAGSDLADGLSVATAWQSITKVNTINFEPGDKVFFEAGKTFDGNIFLLSEDAGTAANPVIFNSYGTGKATLNAGGGKGFVAYNVGGIEVRNLIIKGGVPSSGTPNGIDFFIDQITGNIDYVKIDNVEVFGFKGAGIILSSDAITSNGFNNITITNVVSHDNEYAGLTISGKFTEFNNTNARIAYSKFYNNKGNLGITTENTGNGIRISSIDGLLIEYCEAYENGINSNFSDAGPMGIYVYNTKNAVIQFCESHHNRTSTSHDGGGFSIDGGSINCILQYNYSHDNEGSGFAMYQFYNAPAFENNIIRYNISQNDGRKNSYGALSFWGAAATQKIVNCEVYNNTFYLNSANVSSGTPTAIDFIWNFFTGLKIRNNIFYTTSGTNMVSTDFGYNFTTAEVLFQNNNYYSSGSTNYFSWFGTVYSSYADWYAASGQESVDGRSIDPLLLNPGSHGTIGPADGGDLTMLTGYKLQSGSPMIDAAMNLTQLGVNVGSRDFFNNPIPYNTAFDIGANEFIPATILPVRITDFTSRKVGTKVVLSWRVGTEINVKHYEVERSDNSLNYAVVGSVKAYQSSSYYFDDPGPFVSTVYYRLRIVDNDGRSSYSIIIKVDKEPSLTTTAFYSINAGLHVKMFSDKEKWVAINIFDGLGKQVLSKNQKLYVGQNTFVLHEPNTWQRGMYWIRINNDGKTVLSFIK